jgi:hypothetical protein
MYLGVDCSGLCAFDHAPHVYFGVEERDVLRNSARIQHVTLRDDADAREGGLLLIKTDGQ